MEYLQMELSRLLQIITGAAISVSAAYAAIYAKKWFDYIKEKISLIKDERARKLVESALILINSLIQTNIIAIENTIKPVILKDIMDGKIDKSELSKLAAIVKENVLNQIGKDTTDILVNTIKDVDGYLESKIEEILVSLKDDENSSVQHTKILEQTTAKV